MPIRSDAVLPEVCGGVQGAGGSIHLRHPRPRRSSGVEGGGLDDIRLFSQDQITQRRLYDEPYSTYLEKIYIDAGGDSALLVELMAGPIRRTPPEPPSVENVTQLFHAAAASFEHPFVQEFIRLRGPTEAQARQESGHAHPRALRRQLASVHFIRQGIPVCVSRLEIGSLDFYSDEKAVKEAYDD